MQTMTTITDAAHQLAAAVNDLRGGPQSGMLLGFSAKGPGSEIFSPNARPRCGLARIPYANEPALTPKEAQRSIDAYYGDEG